MAFDNKPRISSDRFGNAYQLKTIYEVVNKKTGEVVSDCYAGYVELGGKLYKVEISPRQKETKKGGNACWMKVTLKKKQSAAAQSM